MKATKLPVHAYQPDPGITDRAGGIEGGHTYHGYCTSQVGAYLALIADRYGLSAVIGEPTEGDPT